MNDDAILESCIPHPNRNVELGGISFTAIQANTKIGIITETAKRMNRPILLVVQQTPGPRFAREFGANVLSHPLVIEAAEDLFVPVALIRGSRNGSKHVADSVAKANGTKTTLSDFDDLTYNTPLVRLLNSVGEDLVPPIPNANATV